MRRFHQTHLTGYRMHLGLSISLLSRSATLQSTGTKKTYLGHMLNFFDQQTSDTHLVLSQIFIVLHILPFFTSFDAKREKKVNKKNKKNKIGLQPVSRSLVKILWFLPRVLKSVSKYLFCSVSLSSYYI